MVKEKQMYILDHYYNVNHEEQCLAIELDKTVEEVVEITSALSFLLEDMTDPSVCLDEEWLLECLEKFYGAENVKEGIEFDALLDLEMPIDTVYQSAIMGHHIVVKKGYLIDLYSARESCCGTKSQEIMEKWLPKGKELEELKTLLMTRYSEGLL